MSSAVIQLIVLAVMLAFLAVFVFIVPAKMAADRNRSQLGWVAVSLIFTPFAAITILAFIGDAPKEDRQ